MKKSSNVKNTNDPLIHNIPQPTISNSKFINAYIPQIAKSTTPTHDSKSKYGGLPYLSPGEQWPKCPTCKKYMSFLVQFSPNQKELYQIFVCFDGADGCYENEASRLVRKILIKGNSAISKKTPTIFEQKEILGYKKKKEMINCDTDDEENIYHGDKFYGIPSVIGYDDNNKTGTLIMQLETEGNVDFMLADCGYIYVFQNGDNLYIEFYND